MSRIRERQMEQQVLSLQTEVKELTDKLNEINGTDFVKEYEITKKALSELQEIHSKQEADFQKLQQEHAALQGPNAKAQGKILDGKYYNAAQLSAQ